jgi:hypothetical protein
MADEFGNQTCTTVSSKVNLSKLMAMVANLPPPEVVENHNLNIGRVCFPMRVTNIVEGKFPRIEGVIENVTSEYPDSIEIKTKEGAKLCYVDKEADMIVAYPLELTAYITGMQNLKSHFGDNIRTVSGGIEDKFVFSTGQSVSLSCDPKDVKMLEEVELFSLVVVGISLSRYVRPLEEQLTEHPGYGVHGVSTKLKQLVTKEQMTEKMLIAKFLTDPGIFQVPLPPVKDIINASGYKHVRSVDNPSKAQSKQVLLIPVLPSNEQALQFFGQNKGCFAHFNFTDKSFSYCKKTDPSTAVGKTEGTLIVSSWTNEEQLTHFLSTHRYRSLEQIAQCEFMSWESLQQAKIVGVDTWKLFAQKFFTMPIIVMAKVNLYETAEHMEAQKDNVHIYNLSVKRFICDFESFIKRNALPIAAADIKAILADKKDTRLTSTSTAPPGTNKIVYPSVVALNNKIDTANDDYFLVNEMPDRVTFFQSPVSETAFDYFALPLGEITPAIATRIKLVHEYAATHPENKVLCGPLLWPAWDSNPEDYTKHTSLPVPADHPLVLKPCGPIAGPVLIYAFNREICDEQNAKAQKYAEKAKQERDSSLKLLEPLPVEKRKAEEISDTDNEGTEDMEVVTASPAKKAFRLLEVNENEED